MNLPNLLTVIRALLIPVYLYFYYGGAYAAAAAVFAAACLTDFLDGRIARKYNLVTAFGKFCDPLADKLLTMAAFVAFAAEGVLDGVIVIILLAREFVITGFRLVAAEKGVVIPADVWGKIKTVLQMALILCLLLFENVLKSGRAAEFGGAGELLSAAVRVFFGAAVLWGLTALTVFFSMFSAFMYIYNNKEVFKNE